MDNLLVGEGQQSSTFSKSNKHVGLGNEVVESFHEVFGDKIGPSLLIVRILHDGSEHLIADIVHMFQNIFGDFNKDDVVFEGLFVEFVASDPQDDVTWMEGWILFRLYLSMEGVSVVRETWSAPMEKA